MKPPLEVFILVVLAFSTSFPAFSNVRADPHLRRILHHPLFPADPPAQSPPAQNAPFFPLSPPESPANNTRTIPTSTNVSNQPIVKSQSIKPAGKIFISVSASLAVLLLVSVLACIWHNRRSRNPTESERLVKRVDANKHRSEETSWFPAPETSGASQFPYIGTMEPSGGRCGEIKNSPYHRLNESHIRLDMHQPSPELQPLPQLTGPQKWCPPALASLEEEESHHSARASVAGSNSSPLGLSLQRSFTYSTTSIASTNITSTSTTGRGSAPPRLAGSPTIAIRMSSVPSPNLEPMLLPQQLSSPQPETSSPPKTGVKFALPLSSLAGQSSSSVQCLPSALSQGSHHRPPPPPPPLLRPLPPPPYQQSQLTAPPPPPSQRQHPILNSRLPEPCPPPMALCAQNGAQTVEYKGSDHDRTEKPAPVPPVTEDPSSKKFNGTGANNEKPRLKPLHWDKVRASSDRVMVWDRLSLGLIEQQLVFSLVCSQQIHERNSELNLLEIHKTHWAVIHRADLQK